MSMSTVPNVEAVSKPDVLSSEPSALVSKEPAIIAEIPSLDVTAKIVAVRDYATALRVVNYDKETFDWRLYLSINKKEAPLLSYQAGFKKEDSAYFVEIKAAKEERARLNIYIHQLKTKQNQKRVEARSKSQELETLISEVALTNTLSSQVIQAISHLKEQMMIELESSEALKTKIREALENF
ncbi:hypothetical protein AMTR_s00080p00016830 [Amborella trichopoda]|uniref:Uncharacterized protein n=1 Tax=Amborella trichopoda TaxID=13333 RepID=W1PAC9_AMBTC|nr:hypothetical protein AMTR_s00080p00016830 [Amborella trichopoda]